MGRSGATSGGSSMAGRGLDGGQGGRCVVSLSLEKLPKSLQKALVSARKSPRKAADVDKEEEDSESVVVQVTRGKLGRILCLFCDRSFQSQKLYLKHSKVHLTSSLGGRRASARPSAINGFPGCSLCVKDGAKVNSLKFFSHSNNLNALFLHLTEKHGDRYHGCKLCKTRVESADDLEEHVRISHKKDDKLEERILTRQSKFERKSNRIPRNAEPTLSRLGLAQNRSPRVRPKGKPSATEPKIMNPRRSKLNRSVSNLSITTDSSASNSTTLSSLPQTSAASTTSGSSGSQKNQSNSSLNSNGVFDENFYENVTTNVKFNMAMSLDGKLDSSSVSKEALISDPPPTVRSTVVKSPLATENEIHEATNLSTTTAFPTLLTADQYGIEGSGNKMKRIFTKNSWKWKWDFIKKYKFVNEGGKIVKKVKENSVGLRDLSKLDMWTQLTMRMKHEVFEKSTSLTNPEIGETVREGKRKLVDELNTILDSRLLPKINVEQNEQRLIKLEPVEELEQEPEERISQETIQVQVKTVENSSNSSSSFTEYFKLQRNELSNPDRDVVLSGEWARPRCYVCFGCGEKFHTIKMFEDHKQTSHPHVQATYYEIVGRELIEGNLYKHLYIPKKAFGIVQEEREKAKEVKVQVQSDEGSQIKCTKCNKDCVNRPDLYRHMLDCVGDYAWLMAKKRLKYRYFNGNRSKRRKTASNRLIFGTLRTAIQRTANKERKQKIKRRKMKSRQKPKRPSDAESIQRMLANLPAKRISRQIYHTVGTKQRSKEIIQQTKARISNKNSAEGVPEASGRSSLDKPAIKVANKQVKSAVSFVNSKPQTEVQVSKANNVKPSPAEPSPVESGKAKKVLTSNRNKKESLPKGINVNSKLIKNKKGSELEKSEKPLEVDNIKISEEVKHANVEAAKEKKVSFLEVGEGDSKKIQEDETVKEIAEKEAGPQGSLIEDTGEKILESEEAKENPIEKTTPPEVQSQPNPVVQVSETPKTPLIKRKPRKLNDCIARLTAKLGVPFFESPQPNLEVEVHKQPEEIKSPIAAPVEVQSQDIEEMPLNLSIRRDPPKEEPPQFKPLCIFTVKPTIVEQPQETIMDLSITAKEKAEEVVKKPEVTILNIPTIKKTCLDAIIVPSVSKPRQRYEAKAIPIVEKPQRKCSQQKTKEQVRKTEVCLAKEVVSPKEIVNVAPIKARTPKRKITQPDKLINSRSKEKEVLKNQPSPDIQSEEILNIKNDIKENPAMDVTIPEIKVNGTPDKVIAISEPIKETSVELKNDLSKKSISPSTPIENSENEKAIIENDVMIQNKLVEVKKKPVEVKIKHAGPKNKSKPVEIKDKQVKSQQVEQVKSGLQSKKDEIKDKQVEVKSGLKSKKDEIKDKVEVKSQQVEVKNSVIKNNLIEVMDKSVEVKDKPVEINQKQIEVSDKQLRNKDKPVEVKNNHVEVNDKLVEVKEKQVENKDKLVENKENHKTILKNGLPEESKTNPPEKEDLDGKKDLPFEVSSKNCDSHLSDTSSDAKDANSKSDKNGSKPRKKRKNELAQIIADQLLESFKEVDKSRIDELKILHDLSCSENNVKISDSIQYDLPEKPKRSFKTAKQIKRTPKKNNTLKNKSKEKVNPVAVKSKPIVESELNGFKPSVKKVEHNQENRSENLTTEVPELKSPKVETTAKPTSESLVVAIPTQPPPESIISPISLKSPIIDASKVRQLSIEKDLDWVSKASQLKKIFEDVSEDSKSGQSKPSVFILKPSRLQALTSPPRDLFDQMKASEKPSSFCSSIFLPVAAEPKKVVLVEPKLNVLNLTKEHPQEESGKITAVNSDVKMLSPSLANNAKHEPDAETKKDLSPRKRKTRKTLIYKKKAKTKVQIEVGENLQKFFCEICNKTFEKADRLAKHKVTLTHISKLSEIEFLNSQKKEENVESPKIEVIPEVVELPSTPLKSPDKTPKMENLFPLTLPSNNSIQLEPISSPEHQPLSINSKLSVSGLSQEEKLFYECCNMLKASDRTALDVDKNAFSPTSNKSKWTWYSKTSSAFSVHDSNRKHSFSKIDPNQFSDISSDSNSMLPIAQPPLHMNNHSMSSAQQLQPQEIVQSDDYLSDLESSHGGSENECFNRDAIIDRTNNNTDFSKLLSGENHISLNVFNDNSTNTMNSLSMSSLQPTQIRTKAAMKGFDSFKISIPTTGLDIQQALDRHSHAESKLATLADIALSTDLPQFSTINANNQKVIFEKEEKIVERDVAIEKEPTPIPEIKPIKTKPTEVKNNISNRKTTKKTPVGNKLGFKTRRKKAPSANNVSSKVMKKSSKEGLDVYDFEESEDSVQCPIVPLKKPFKPPNSATEEVKSSPSNPEAYQSQLSSDSFSDRDDFNYNGTAVEDSDEMSNNDGENKLEASVKKGKKLLDTVQKKCLIMGRIFKNAQKNKPVPEEKPSFPTDGNQNKIEKVELDQLFDSLKKDVSKKEEQIESNSTEGFIKGKEKPRQIAKHNKKANMNKIEDELGMSKEEIEALIGIGQRKSKRKCIQQVSFAETWSSDEYEEFQSTKDIIALIEEKECANVKLNKTSQKKRVGENKTLDGTNSKEKQDVVVSKPAAKIQNRRKTIAFKEHDDEKPRSKGLEYSGRFSPVRKLADKKKQQKCLTEKQEKSSNEVIKSKDKDKVDHFKDQKNRPLARRKRLTSEMLYYWPSSSSDEEEDDAEGLKDVTKGDRLETEFDKSKGGMEQHGWIVGDSHKKLVTLLAHAKGKKTDVMPKK